MCACWPATRSNSSYLPSTTALDPFSDVVAPETLSDHITFTGPSSSEAWSFTDPLCAAGERAARVWMVLLFGVLLDDRRWCAATEGARYDGDWKYVLHGYLRT